ncbi:MAG: hypothetical protein SFU83_14960 [Meiothermus sp.]|nr:hypothetical protein [Meiothermus sp.]
MDSWLPLVRVFFLLAAFAVARALWPISIRCRSDWLIDWMLLFAVVGGLGLSLGLVGDMTQTVGLEKLGTFIGFGSVGVLLLLLPPLAARIGRVQHVAKKLTESDERLPPDAAMKLARGGVLDTSEIPAKR